MGIVAGTLALSGGYLLGNGIASASSNISNSVDRNVNKACTSLHQAFTDHGHLLAEGARGAGREVRIGMVEATDKLRLYDSAVALTGAVKEVATSIGSHAAAVNEVARSIAAFRDVVQNQGVEFNRSVAEMNRVLESLAPSFGVQMLTAIAHLRQTGFDLITYFFLVGTVLSASVLYCVFGHPVNHLLALIESLNALYADQLRFAHSRPIEFAMYIYLFSVGFLCAFAVILWKCYDLHIKREFFELQLLNEVMKADTERKVQRCVDSLPDGCIVAFSGQNPPQGWLLCDGSVFSARQYPVLARLIENAFDYGGGALRLPDLRARTIVGVCRPDTPNHFGLQARLLGSYFGRETAELTVRNLPPHAHVINNAGSHGHRISLECGAQAALQFMPGGLYSQVTNSRAPGRGFMGPDPFIENSGDHTHTCQPAGQGEQFELLPPSLVLHYIIKATAVSP